MAVVITSEIIEDRLFPGDARTITERHWDELGVPWYFNYWGTAATKIRIQYHPGGNISVATAAATDDGVCEFYVDCDGTAGTVNVDDWSVA